MRLSLNERRELAGIAARLRAEDPQLAKLLAEARGLRRALLLWRRKWRWFMG